MSCTKWMRIFGVILALGGAVGIGGGPFAADVAYAKGKDGNNGGGNGGGKGAEKSGGKSSKATGNQRTKSTRKASSSNKGLSLKRLFTKKRTVKQRVVKQRVAKPKVVKQRVAKSKVASMPKTRPQARPVKATKPDKLAPGERGKLASELKWMNAAHASQTALENASPNSRPGQLYAYQQSIIGYGEAEERVRLAEEERARLEGLTDEEIDSEFAPTEEEAANGITAQDKYDEALADAEEELAAAETALNTDPETARQELEDAQAELDRLEGLDSSDPEFQPTDEEVAEGLTAQDKYDAALAEAEAEVQAAQELADAAVTDPDAALDTLTGDIDLSPEALVELHRLLRLDPPDEDETAAAASDEGTTDEG